MVCECKLVREALLVPKFNQGRAGSLSAQSLLHITTIYFLQRRPPLTNLYPLLPAVQSTMLNSLKDKEQAALAELLLFLHSSGAVTSKDVMEALITFTVQLEDLR